MAVENRAPRPREAPPRDEDADEDERPIEAEELGGESEHSLTVAGQRERGTTRRVPEGQSGPEPLSADPEELGRRYLEGATQAPAPSRERREEVRFPGEGEEEG